MLAAPRRGTSSRNVTLTAHSNALPGSIINDFNAAAVEKGVIYKINP
jgi:hypothetical protein